MELSASYYIGRLPHRGGAKVPCAAAFPLISGITATFQGGAQWPKPQNSAAFPLISRITAVFPNPILKIWRRSRLEAFEF